MSLFHPEEPPNASKRCKFLKDALATCHTFCRKISSQTLEQDDDDDDVSDYDDEQEVISLSTFEHVLTLLIMFIFVCFFSSGFCFSGSK